MDSFETTVVDTDTIVDNNIKIYSVKKDNISLEDAFLKKTGGNVID